MVNPLLLSVLFGSPCLPTNVVALAFDLTRLCSQYTVLIKEAISTVRVQYGGCHCISKGATENKRQVGHFINTGIQNMERSKLWYKYRDLRGKLSFCVYKSRLTLHTYSCHKWQMSEEMTKHSSLC